MDDENYVIFKRMKAIVDRVFGSSKPDVPPPGKMVEDYLGRTPEEQGISADWLRPMETPPVAPSVDVTQGSPRK